MENNTNKITLKTMRGDVTAEVKRDKTGQIVIKTHQNSLFIPLLFFEALIIGILMTFNYLFRFDPIFRVKCDMIDFKKVLLSCDEVKLKTELSRPYFDYGLSDTKSSKGLQLNYDLPEWVFFLCALLIPILIFCLIETLRAVFEGKRKKEIEIYGLVIPQPARRISRIIGVYLLGGSITGLFVTVFKLNIISPRPYFMSSCFENMAEIVDFNCLTLWSPSEECSNNSTEELVEALKAFPSYHAALAVYCGVFVSAYIILVARVRGSYTPSIAAIFCLMVMTVIGGTHRLSSGHSFPRDILGGAFIGLVIAYYTVRVLLNNFRERKLRIKKNNLNSTENCEENEHDSFCSDDEEESDNEWKASAEEYAKIASKIDSISFIPRVPASTRRQPMQAVNPAFSINDERPRFISNSSLTSPKSELPIRSSSSASTMWHSKPYNQPYNVSRQRNSAPLRRMDPPINAYTNYGFENDRMQKSKGILTPYNPPLGTETTSHF